MADNEYLEEVIGTPVSAFQALAEELKAEYAAAESTLKPELSETPDPAFVAWAESAKFDAAALWETTRAQALAVNAAARATMAGLTKLLDLIAIAPRDQEEFTIKRTATSLLVSVGNLTRSIGVAAHNATISDPAAPVSRTKGDWGNQGGTGGHSRIRVIRARRAEHAEFVDREFTRDGKHSAAHVLGLAAGLFTPEQYNSERGENGRRNKVANYFAWVTIG